MDVNFSLAMVTIIVAGVVRGFSGFGAGMILVPVLSVLYNPLVAVVTVAILEFFPSILLLPRAIAHCHWRSVIPMSIVAVCAIPFGSMLLVQTPAETMRIGIACLVLIGVAVLATGRRYKGSLDAWHISTSTGLLSGVVSGATSLGGLPVVLYYLSSTHSAVVARASIIVFLVTVVLTALATYFAQGIVTTEIAVRAGWLAPFFILAIWLGGRSFGNVSDIMFRRLTLGLLGCIGVGMLFTH